MHLEVREVVGRLADGIRYTFWTLGGHVPGMLICIREGDEVEMHGENRPDSKNPRPHGQRAAPGRSSVFSFTALS